MYAQLGNIAPSSSPSAPRLAVSRAALRTCPRIQRAVIRSWEYNQPVRVTVLVIRLLVALWLVFLGSLLLSQDNSWGWILLPAAAAVAAIGAWVFTTAAKGWPANV
jgi:hypothetical protein